MQITRLTPAATETRAGGYLIRPALRQEIPDLSTLIEDSISAYMGQAPERLLQLYIERSRDVASRFDRGGVLVALQDERIAGTVTFHTEASFAGFPGWASFGTLAVHPDMQGRGVGTALVRRCIALAMGTSSPAIGIHTASFMRTACRLYEGMGFVRHPSNDLRASNFIAIDPAEGDIDVLAYRLDLGAD